jgi:small subunit ribosomal protein S20
LSEDGGKKELANHKSAIKRARQSEIRRLRNRGYKTRVKNAIKGVRASVSENSPDQARENLIAAVSIIQKTASKGIIHRKTAARKISRLSRQVNRISS